MVEWWWLVVDKEEVLEKQEEEVVEKQEEEVVEKHKEEAEDWQLAEEAEADAFVAFAYQFE